ncbi:competence pheromone ComX [Bacillus ndiopicus]|uniref:competence pheromone ComX n=1 Tax=Bacillus ndiopicus TaxID=1347368 RepID=UPI000A8DBDA8|nr:competence pheromone ComX [Bacillus ndiopicus]
MVSKLIKYLKENPQLVQLLQEDKLSLVGVSKWEQQAITEAMKGPMKVFSYSWRQ